MYRVGMKSKIVFYLKHEKKTLQKHLSLLLVWHRLTFYIIAYFLGQSIIGLFFFAGLCAIYHPD